MKNKWFWVSLAVAGLGAAFGCSKSGGGPGAVAKLYYQYLDSGSSDAAVKLMSKEVVKTMGEEKVKAAVSAASMALKMKGGVKSIEIVKEDIKGDKADVSMKIKFGNGEDQNAEASMVKEDGTWKMAK